MSSIKKNNPNINRKKERRRKGGEPRTEGKGSKPKKDVEVSHLSLIQKKKFHNLVFSCFGLFLMSNPPTKLFLIENLGKKSTLFIDLTICFFSSCCLNSHILRPLILSNGLEEKYFEIKKNSSEQELNPNEKMKIKILNHLFSIMIIYIFYSKGMAFTQSR